ncbi:hypothetical protein [Fodinibius salsisoli]|uniref:Outer membrane protein beta-barrel domain-containing protein n=1 Tax=Fodinibius salsisoli TaxID=2820877 RepID=A0ABT3PJ16_9BACT|nr:hypothetical protein [Fodinibius salsisoli]MCW9705743.1 hypothetical protein [Fodinibius salsisoli]
MIKHSRKRLFQHSFMLKVLLITLFVVVSADITRAQMFSADSDRQAQFNAPKTELYLGFEPATVTYQGEEGIDGAGQFSYDAPVIRAGFSSRALNLYLGAGGKVTGSDDVGYFDVGGNLNFGLPLYITEKFILLLPFRISSRLTNITNDRTSAAPLGTRDQFRFGGITAGAGLKANARPKPNIRIQLGAIPSYGFTFASGGLFGGSLGTLALNGRLFFDRLFGDTGLSLGYKYDLRNYNVDEEKYDYRVNGHSIQVGITF